MVEPQDQTKPRKKRCGAKNRAGQPCQRWAINGRDRCQKHGGRAKRGPDSKSWKHGGRSQFLPVFLAERFVAAKEDPGLMQIREDVALVEAMIASLSATMRGKGLTPKQEERLLALIDQRRMLVTAEHKRQRDLRQLVPVESAMALVRLVMNSLLKHAASHPDIILAVRTDVQRAQLAIPTQPEATPGAGLSSE